VTKDRDVLIVRRRGSEDWHWFQRTNFVVSRKRPTCCGRRRMPSVWWRRFAALSGVAGNRCRFRTCGGSRVSTNHVWAACSPRGFE